MSENEHSQPDPAEDAPPPPANRAERRARGKGAKGQPAARGKGGITGSKNLSSGPRMWTNRRGGG